MKRVIFLGFAGLFVLSLAGCQAFRISIDEEDPSKASALTTQYDQRDLINWSEAMAQQIMAHPFPPAGEDQPILVDMGIENRTQTHADMKAITDTITLKLMDAGKIRLVNNSRRDQLMKEQGFQAANATPESKVAIGQQLGAKYMLTGSLIEIARDSGKEVRLSKSQDNYYQLTIEITDMETGLITLRKQLDRLRRGSKPIIGW